MKVTAEVSDWLVCPRSKSDLKLVSLVEAQACLNNGAPLKPIRRKGLSAPRVGATDYVMMSTRGRAAFPIMADFPILLWPDALVPDDYDEVVDLNDLKYQEAFKEMEHDNPFSIERARTLNEETVCELMGLKGCSIQTVEDVVMSLQVDAAHDYLSQKDAYDYLSPVNGRSFLQLGGSGSHAVKALLAGARHATLLTPMYGEGLVAFKLADYFGIADRLSCVIGVGEEIPLRSNSVELVYSGGCMHHMRLDIALTEIHRILTPGGRFSAVDPWKAPLYSLGTKIFGKRKNEKNVHCRPISKERLNELSQLFLTHRVVHHGPFLRYPFIVLEKIGIKIGLEYMAGVAKFDDTVGRSLGLIDILGSSVMFCGEKTDLHL